jgi:hypothetical protein
MSTETKMYLDPEPSSSSFYFGGYRVRFGSCSPRIVKGINKNPRFIYTNKNKNVNTATISKNTNR